MPEGDGGKLVQATIFVVGQGVLLETSLLPAFKNRNFIDGERVLIEASFLPSFEMETLLWNQISCFILISI